MSGISLSGLASGLDTNAMITQLMKLEKQPYERMELRRTDLADRQAVIRSINTKLSTLRTAASELMYTTTFNLTAGKASDATVLGVRTNENAAAGSYNVQVDQLAKKHVVSTMELSTNGTQLKDLADDGETLTFTAKGSLIPKTITLKGDTNEEVMNNLMKDINAAKVGVKASIVTTSPGNKTLILTSDEMGTAANMKLGVNADSSQMNTFISADNDDVLTTLGFKVGTEINERQAAQDAQVTINGIEITSNSNTLTNVVEGMTIDLLKEGASSTITVAKDTDKIAEKVQAFVDAYNEIIDIIRTNSAKDGLMQGDSTLRTLQDELSGIVNASVSSNSTYKFLFSIGLEIDKGVLKGSEMTGKINFDKTKFAQALNANPDEVIKLFGFDDTTSANKDGIALQLNNKLGNWTRFGTGMLAFKISGYDSELSTLAEQMDRFNTRLQNREQQLLRQFAAMENALSSLNNEKNWLNSQINAMFAQK